MNQCPRCGFYVQNISTCSQCSHLQSLPIEIIALEEEEFLDEIVHNPHDLELIALEEGEQLGTQDVSQPPSSAHPSISKKGSPLLVVASVTIIFGLVFYFLNQPSDVQKIAPSTPPITSTTTNDTAAEDTTAEDTTAEDTTAEDTTAEDTTAEDTTAEDTTAEDTTAEDTTAEDTAAEDTAAEDTTAEDTTARDTSPRHVDSSMATEVPPPRLPSSRVDHELLAFKKSSSISPSPKPSVQSITASQREEAWYCVCYEERLGVDSDDYQTSTACRRTEYQCNRLSRRIVQNQSPLMRAGDHFTPCTLIGYSVHPHQALLGRGRRRELWSASKFKGMFWSNKGCLLR